jgi:iron complex outermembrane recepter protein
MSVRTFATALALLAPTSALAQTVLPNPGSAFRMEGEVVGLDNFVVTGTRFNGRLVSESPVPIDVIAAHELATGGYTDFQRMLKARVPAFSLPNSVGTGSPDFVNAPTLRGLGIGQMLVLVNGKRRHTTGDVSTGQQIGRGDVGYDFNPFPAEALGRVEVLRDGASAQYGSDAIAGVINLVLDRSLGGRGTALVGTTTEGDGEVADFTAGYGIPLGRDGFLRATVFRQDHGYTNRAGLDTRQQYFGSNGTVMPSGNYGSGIGLTPSNGVLDPREATIDRNTFRFGSPSYLHHGIVVNAEYPVGKDAALYTFGGWSEME